MKRPALYSRSSSTAPARSVGVHEHLPSQAQTQAQAQAQDGARVSQSQAVPPAAQQVSGWQRFGGVLSFWLHRQPRSAAFALGALLVVSAFGLFTLLQTSAQALSQEDIDNAVKHALQTVPLPSPAARAYEQIISSVVMVRSFVTPRDKKGKLMEEEQLGVGTGVVIVDKGIILTNLHVVQKADRLEVTFMDGLTSTAHITSVQAKDDLAVLQAHKIPDDLTAAALASTANLKPGDMVAAVGFPFGIGPSVSSGVVSGLKREFKSPESGEELTNLIQFDAAANPGNSGGPLVNAQGEVVGIVTGILNPAKQRTFIGIGFAVPIENAASAAGMPPF
jgi:S1-C subfamily serine protease